MISAREERIRRSLDGGQSLRNGDVSALRTNQRGVDNTRHPGDFRCPPLGCLAVAPVVVGHLYYVYPDTTSIKCNGYNVDVYFTRLLDDGGPWSSPVVLNGDSALAADQFFQWIEKDNDGRLHVLFYDTRLVIQDDDADLISTVDAWYAWSDDEGSHWGGQRLTATPIDTSPSRWGARQYTGDDLRLASARGRAFPAYSTLRRVPLTSMCSLSFVVLQLAIVVDMNARAAMMTRRWGVGTTASTATRVPVPS
ncbi:MAG: hypothetical protein ACI841_005005 [Planctomycetota bacterium]|jgi:hypothetical protein